MNHPKINIILIDDNIAFCRAAQFYFEIYEDINIKIYHDPLHFLNEYHSQARGFIIMDLFMSSMDGLSLLEELNLRNNKMIIFVISGHADPVTVEQIKALGATDFLSKPFDIDILLSTIREMDKNNKNTNQNFK